jgi:hypothetical protein
MLAAGAPGASGRGRQSPFWHTPGPPSSPPSADRWSPCRR